MGGTNKDAVEADKDGDADMGETDKTEQSNLVEKSMEVFNADTDKMDNKRYITWYRNGPFDLGARHTKTTTQIGDYKINLPETEQKKKVKIEAKMSIHGIFSVDNAHVVEVEEYEEIVKEKREIKEEEGDASMPD